MRCPSAVPALLLTLAALLLPVAAHPDAVLDVTGGIVATAPRLTVRVLFTNRGDVRAGPIEVRAELFGEPAVARLPGGLDPGASAAVTLDFTAAPPRPGLHALTLLVEHALEGPPDAAGNPPTASDRAFLLLGVGANPGPAVRVAAEPFRLDVRGLLRVRLESEDGTAHRVRLRALTGRGLRPEGEALEVGVPASGWVSADLAIARAGAARGPRQALLLVAETLDGALARTTVAAATAELLPDPARLPGLRVPLAAAGLALLGLALGYEVRWRVRARSSSKA